MEEVRKLSGSASPQINVNVDVVVPEFCISDFGDMVEDTGFRVIQKDVREKTRDRRAHWNPRGFPVKGSIKQIIILIKAQIYDFN